MFATQTRHFGLTAALGVFVLAGFAGCGVDPSAENEFIAEDEAQLEEADVGEEADALVVPTPDSGDYYNPNPWGGNNRGARLCHQTGGSWDRSSCGHYKCGQRPWCNAIQPGCNCGPGKTFQEGYGCAYDRSCNAHNPGGPGHPGNPGGPGHPGNPGGPWSPGGRSCWYDRDCRPGSRCVGAVICPPGAYCYAPNRPGRCERGWSWGGYPN